MQQLVSNSNRTSTAWRTHEITPSLENLPNVQSTTFVLWKIRKISYAHPSTKQVLSTSFQPQFQRPWIIAFHIACLEMIERSIIGPWATFASIREIRTLCASLFIAAFPEFRPIEESSGNHEPRRAKPIVPSEQNRIIKRNSFELKVRSVLHICFPLHFPSAPALGSNVVYQHSLNTPLFVHLQCTTYSGASLEERESDKEGETVKCSPTHYCYFVSCNAVLKREFALRHNVTARER